MGLSLGEARVLADRRSGEGLADAARQSSGPLASGRAGVPGCGDRHRARISPAVRGPRRTAGCPCPIGAARPALRCHLSHRPRPLHCRHRPLVDAVCDVGLAERTRRPTLTIVSSVPPERRDSGLAGSRPLALPGVSMERVTGIEPALSAWEADVLPLNYTRVRSIMPHGSRT